MADTENAIVNRALARIGIQQRVADFRTEEGENAKAALLFYDTMRDAILNEFPWPFAQKREALALLTQDPLNTDYDFTYRYPTDCVRMHRIVNTAGRIETDPLVYDVGNDVTARVIFTDIEEAIGHYTSRFTDPSNFPEYFADTLAWRLAAEMGMPLAIKPSFAQFAREEYRRSMEEAKSKAINEIQPDPKPISEFQRARNV